MQARAELQQAQRSDRQKIILARNLFHRTVTTAYELVKKGGQKNLREAWSIVKRELLSIESAKFVKNLCNKDLLMKYFDAQENEAATKKFNESKPFLRSFEQTMSGLEQLGILDKEGRKTGINKFTDLYAVYLNALQNDYDFEDIRKFGEVVRKCASLNAADHRSFSHSTLRMTNWKSDEAVSEKQIASEMALIDSNCKLAELHAFAKIYSKNGMPSGIDHLKS